MKTSTVVCLSLAVGLVLSCGRAADDNFFVYYEGLLPEVTPKG